MAPRPPSTEELLDLAWMLDAALMRRRRNRALRAADLLVTRLTSHDEDMAVRRRRLDPDTAEALADGSLDLLADRRHHGAGTGPHPAGRLNRGRSANYCST